MYTNVSELIDFIEHSKRQEKKTSLDKMFSLCSLFDNPQEDIPFIHIGGTNGKGSTVSYIKNILMKSGFNVGSFISPYVVCFNERINLNNDYISDDDLLRIGNMIIDKCLQNGYQIPAFFDFVTLIAFIYFKELYKKGLVDYVVLEVGMGGIFDSTNVVRPMASIITNVDYDHMGILGNTLEEIWLNKLGIMKENTLFLCYHSPYDYLVNNKAKLINNLDNVVFLNKEDVKVNYLKNFETSFNYKEYKDIKLHLLGKYQAENASLAIEAILALNNNHMLIHQVTTKEIYQGLAKTFWPGRLEIMSKKPLIILDGAHNVDAVLRLKEFLEMYPFTKKIRLVIAISANKEVEKMIKIIEPLANQVIYTQFNYRRSNDANHLYNISNHPNKILVEDDNEILPLILSDNDYDNVLFGSLYFVSEMRKKLIELN